jgi:hypothetical protein
MHRTAPRHHRLRSPSLAPLIRSHPTPCKLPLAYRHVGRPPITHIRAPPLLATAPAPVVLLLPLVAPSSLPLAHAPSSALPPTLSTSTPCRIAASRRAGPTSSVRAPTRSPTLSAHFEEIKPSRIYEEYSYPGPFQPMRISIQMRVHLGRTRPYPLNPPTKHMLTDL